MAFDVRLDSTDTIILVQVTKRSGQTCIYILIFSILLDDFFHQSQTFIMDFSTGKEEKMLFGI